MMEWLAARFGAQAAKVIAFVVIALAILAIVFVLGRCTRHDPRPTAQAEQTERSGDALANAAANAVETVQNRTVTDSAVDAAVNNATKEIDNAQNASAVRDAVIAGVCGQSSHRRDPACAVR